MKYCFTIDDNIVFLSDLTSKYYADIFDNPYLKGLKNLHEKYGVKIQLNLFYEGKDFDLSKMAERYKEQFISNSDWMKMSFHSKEENVRPYEFSGYEEVYSDIKRVNDEIVRFAGEKTLAETTTVHYCLLTEEGKKAVKDNGVKGLLGLFGDCETKRTSYGIEFENAERIRKGEVVTIDGIKYASIDVVMNSFDKETVQNKIRALIGREFVKIMIHEQYFYKDYFNYQPEFFDKIESAIKILKDNGYESSFYQDF